MMQVHVQVTPEGYEALAGQVVREVRRHLGMSVLTLTSRRYVGSSPPVLLIDFYNARGKLSVVSLVLPPGEAARTKGRMSALLKHLMVNAQA